LHAKFLNTPQHNCYITFTQINMTTVHMCTIFPQICINTALSILFKSNPMQKNFAQIWFTSRH